MSETKTTKTTVKTDDNFQSAFDGLMLGDGCITKCRKSINYHYSQRCKYHEWLDNIEHLFAINRLNTHIDKHNINNNFGTSILYHLWSHNSLFFTEQHNRWYKKWYDIDKYPTRLWHQDEDKEWFVWKKIVPKDIKLTPVCVLNWYLGDGSISKHALGNGYSLKLSTHSFTKEDVKYLEFVLNDQVVDCAYISSYENSYFINITKKLGIIAFLSYIKDLKKPSCYNYKFPEA